MPTYTFPSQDDGSDYDQKRSNSFGLAFSPDTDLMLGDLAWRLSPPAQPGVFSGPFVGQVAPPRPVRGALSEQYESGGRGPGTISTGKGDSGGQSYGAYQLASKLGRPEAFIAGESAPWTARFQGLHSGTEGFNDAWRATAAQQGEAFGAAQRDYIDRTHFQVQLGHVRDATGQDLSKASDALQDVIWSTAVQNGPRTNVIVRAMKNVPLNPGDHGYDEALIRAIYAERGRKNADGTLAYFSKNSPKTQTSVSDRFVKEQKDALDRLRAERPG